MKKIIPFLILLCSFTVKAQDTLSLPNFKMQVRLAALAVNFSGGDDDLFYSLRTAYKSATNKGLSDSLTVDTVTVDDYLRLYKISFLYQFNIGNKFNQYLSDHAASMRLTNLHLNREMTKIEEFYNADWISFREAGLLKLKRKN